METFTRSMKAEPGSLDLHWSAGDLNLNFQLDGADSRGEVTMYQDKLTIFYW